MSIKNGLLAFQKFVKTFNIRPFPPVLNVAQKIHINSPGFANNNFAKKFGYSYKPEENFNVQILSKREKHHEAPKGGDGGSTLPIYKSIGKPLRLTIIFVLFFGFAFWAPMILFVYMMIR